jgi:hypothetical protein
MCTKMSNKAARLALAIAFLAGRTFCGVAAGQTPGPAPSSATVLPAADLEFLHDLTREVVEESRVPPGKRVADSPAKSVGVFRPQGLCPKWRLYDLRDPPVGHSAITQMKPCRQESCGNLGGRSGERKDRKGVSGYRHRQANGMAET